MTEISPQGEALKALRDAAGMTIQQVADAAGLSPSYVSRAENNQVTPTAGWWQMVAVAIGRHIAAGRVAA